MDTLLQELIATVQRHDFPHKEEFLDAVAAGRCAVHSSYSSDDEAAVAASQLLNIYRRRRDHLGSKHSAHAQALASDIAWFCTRLELMPSGQVVIRAVDIGHPYTLDFFIDKETKSVLGCLRTVSKLDVTPEQWEQLWSDE